MNNLTNFAFGDQLVRVVERDSEPWFVGKDVCEVLQIRDYRQSLERLDDDERGGCDIPTPGGEQTMIVISEAGVYRLTFRSRKPQAEAFKRWLAHEVLPQIRRTGFYAVEPAARPALDGEAPLAARVDAVRLCARLFGRERARELWNALKLPAVPPASEYEGTGEARYLMDRLLDHEPPGGEGRNIRQLILDAIDGSEVARLALTAFGIRASAELDGFWLANSAPAVRAVYADTQWRDGTWRIALRRLRGVAQGEGRQSLGGVQSRLTWFSLDALDESADL